MNFDTWYSQLISDEKWYELLRHYKSDTIKKAGEKVFDELVTLKTLGHRTIEEDRLHVYRVCKKLPEDKPKGKPWQVQEAEKAVAQIESEWQPVTGEERERKLKEWQDMVNGSKMLNSMPKPSYKQLAEEGGVLPPKPAPYPCTSKEEVYIKDRRFAYIKQAFEARTGDKLPGAIDEETFNALYDEKHLTDKGL